jgi:hypothetical protein
MLLAASAMGRVRGGLLAGQDVAVGVSAQHADAAEALQQLEHLGGPRAEQHKVTKGPPAVHVQALRVLQHGAQRHVVAVDVSDDAQPHAHEPMNCRWAETRTELRADTLQRTLTEGLDAAEVRTSAT